MEIFPSLISADLLNLEEVIKRFDSNCDGYHIDVMDDHFVPNLTWGPVFANAILQKTTLPIHLHLMVDDPVKWLDRVAFRRDDIFIFHVEAMSSDQKIKDLIRDVKLKGCKVGIALNPKTEVDTIFEYLPDLDHVLLMSVEPGFSGQKFMPEVTGKIASLLQKRDAITEPTLEKKEARPIRVMFEEGDKPRAGFKLGMDGGIGPENIKMLAEMGVEQVGVASAIFSQKNPIQALQNLYKI